MEPVEAMATELARLYKGRGVHAPNLLDRLGPLLREAFEVPSTPNLDELRRTLQAALRDIAAGLPDDLRDALIAAAGLDATNVRLLQGRIDDLAAKLDRAPRTARRRIDEATRLVAEELLMRVQQREQDNPHAPSGWHVDSLSSTLRLDLPSPTLAEDREIIALRDGLDSIMVNLSMPPTPDAQRPLALRLVADFGCEVTSTRQVSSSHWRYDLSLPHRLAVGERHRYGVSFIAPDLRSMQPYYVLVPLRRCRSFEATVHFGSPSVADVAWRLDGVPPAVLDDDEPSRHRYESPDVLTVRFDNIHRGLCYGLRWRLSRGAAG